MKCSVVCIILSILVLPLFGCTSEEMQAVSPTVLEAFTSQKMAAVEQLGTPNACEFLNPETKNGISYGAYEESFFHKLFQFDLAA